MINPTIITHVEHTYIGVLSELYTQLVNISTYLFYILAVIEITLFGLVWAIRQDEALGSFIFKVFKLSIIFFLITTYPVLLKHFIDGFTQMSDHMLATVGTESYLFDPGQVWKLGLNSSVDLLKLAVQNGTLNVGMSLIYIILGFGMLFMFGLIGAIITLFVVGFYLVSLVALLLLPFGVLSIAKRMLTRALTAVIAMGARVFTLVLILGIGFTAWSQLKIPAISQSTNLAEPLGLFFVTLVILVLVLKVPSWVANAVGELGGSIFDDLKPSMTVYSPGVTAVAGAPVVQQAAVANLSSGAAGTSAVASGTNVVGTMGSQAAASGSQVMTTASTPAPTVVASGGGKGSFSHATVKLDKASRVGISQEVLKKLKATFKDGDKNK